MQRPSNTNTNLSNDADENDVVELTGLNMNNSNTFAVRNESVNNVMTPVPEENDIPTHLEVKKTESKQINTETFDEQ